MLVSRNWLQNYFKEKLPEADKLAELFTFHAFEVEGVTKAGDDDVLDLKVLPDRAHYALSHEGIAREISALAKHALKNKEIENIAGEKTEKLEIKIKDNKLCRRYIGRRVLNVKNNASPAWLKEKLEAIGQRSISAIVDATNYVMFDVGQPLHAFDADKVIGAITVRKAEGGETIDLLPEKKVLPSGEVSYVKRFFELQGGELIIADEEGPLALAGIKGGMRAVVGDDTKNIIIESANFDPVAIRKTSTKYNLRNDSSKRFENEISQELAMEAMKEISALIKKLSPDAVFGEIVDEYPTKAEKINVVVTPEYICELLGLKVSEKEIIEILERLQIKVTKQDNALVLDIPYWRLDLKIPQDIAEEVGRIYGYDKIKTSLLPDFKTQSINKNFFWAEKIKDVLTSEKYSEIITYTFANDGEVEIQNPLAIDKGFMRTNLASKMKESLVLNSRNAPFLGLDEIKVFEIGNVFLKKEKDEKEELRLCIGYVNTKSVKNKDGKTKEILEKTIEDIKDKLGLNLVGIGEIIIKEGFGIFECNLDNVLKDAPEPSDWNVNKSDTSKKYKVLSPYPFMLRDIAVFVPEGVKEEKVLEIILQESGDLLVRQNLFDVFEKKFEDGSKKTSYAFRLVFQSNTKTLTDEEINSVMNAITEKLNSNPNWQVR